MGWPGERQRHAMSARGVQSSVSVVMPIIQQKEVIVEPGTKLQLDIEVELPHFETRYGEQNDHSETLHDGQFIVDWIDEYQCHISDAEWDRNGNITFHSNKHGHLISLEDLHNLVVVP